ncbi:alanine racemase domain-containing protein (plasmid) [Rhizobium etli 8C-3]|uniref:Alanine racemase domain-containing protein n=1 Tax=Rhizobium etli 8C-3 TaxID=538025 RepID=A0A1L5PDQ4_RHIET|nr:alanine racemase domain-containing protein [Rhizobium etli 8C-3]
MRENRFAAVAEVDDGISDLSTPRPIADEDRMTVNISRVQSYMDAHDLPLRVHSRRTKSPTPAAAQVAARAIGINCQKAFQRISPNASRLGSWSNAIPAADAARCDGAPRRPLIADERRTSRPAASV